MGFIECRTSSAQDVATQCELLLDNYPQPTREFEGQSTSDAAIQCELLLDDLHGPTREFDITDIGRRRRFVRCLYGLLMLQIAMIIPCLEIGIHYAHILMKLPLRLAYFVFIILLYTWLYIYRDWRRRAPFNYFIYLLTSIAMPISTSIHLIYIDQTRWLHAYPLMIIVELLVLALYTTQQRFKFSHAIGVLIIYSVYGLILLSIYLFFIQGFFRILYFYKVTFEVWYIIYDTRQMLCGDHGYNLQPDEYIYAAGNIHADLPKLLWTIVRHFFVDPIRNFIKAVRQSRTNNIC